MEIQTSTKCIMSWQLRAVLPAFLLLAALLNSSTAGMKLFFLQEAYHQEPEALLAQGSVPVQVCQTVA